ncbi:MAG: D-alanyl-D-alanine carboxypeptidase/D-alanyl-D-alanine-endopeptidase (penicillin-binding protein 4) [Minisyncoccia bacterium]
MNRPIPVGARRPGPRRSKPEGGAGPLVALGAFALIPALGLFALFSWAEGAVDESEPAPPPPSTLVAPPPPPLALSTSMLSLRRLPTVLSRELNISDFERAVVPFLATLNDRSCAVVSVDGILIGSRNPDLAVIPASNQKLIVAAAALDVLGAETRLTTLVSTELAPVDGVVNGDLFLVGGGDPLLSSDWYPTSNLDRYAVLSPTSLDTLADAVRDAGVTQISGGVVGDGSRYDDEFFAPGWGLGVAGLEAGPYDALMANDSRVLNDDQRAGDPNEGAAREFTRMLQERGITVTGGASSGVATPEANVLASIESASVTEIVGEMLMNSDNNTAELLMKEIGLIGEGTGSREAGARVMMAKLGEWGIETSNIVLSDGSGLSLDNRLTCAAVLAVLQRHDPSSALGQALPIAGQTGTLRDIFSDHAVAGRLRGKTGTLNNPPFNVDPPAVKALSGYLPVDGGTAVEYTLMLNGPTISDQSEYRPIWNGLVEALDTYPSGATPAQLGPR